MSEEEFDQFADVKNGTQGIFGTGLGGGESPLKRHDSVTHTVKNTGAVLEFYCQGCGRGRHMTIEWPELVALKFGHNPLKLFSGYPGWIDSASDWEFKQQEQAWAPAGNCDYCPFHYGLRLSPGEAERLLAKGRRQGFVNQAAEQRLNQLCAQTPGRQFAGGR